MGHFVICFLAFLLERNLEFRLKKAGEDASPEKIREVSIVAKCTFFESTFLYLRGFLDIN